MHLIATSAGNDLSTSALAAAANLSVSRLQHLFRESVGPSVRATVQRRRLALAAEALIASHRRVSEICYAVGLKNPCHFNRLFRAHFGESPTSFRRRCERQAIKRIPSHIPPLSASREAHVKSKTSILFLPTNSTGLGHVSRLAAIAQALRCANRDVRVLFGAEGSSSVLLQALGLPFVPVPYGGPKRNDWSGWPGAAARNAIFGMLEGLLVAVDPAVIVFDGWPHDVLSCLAIAQRRLTVLCMRQVTQPEAFIRAQAGLLARVDRILVPHEPAEWIVPPDLLPKVRYVGTVHRTLIRNHEKSEERVVVITGGGGGHPGTATFYNMAMEAAFLLQSRWSCRVLLVTGPLFKEWRDLRMRPGVTLTPFEPSMTSVLDGASLVVAQAGYSTLAEVSSLGVPTIFVRAPRVWDDQANRAASLMHEHQFITMHCGDDAHRLASSMATMLDRPRARRAAGRCAGADRAAQEIIKLVTTRSQAGWPEPFDARGKEEVQQ